jgi:hypothetical protein
MKARAIAKKDYALILGMDKKIYPTDSPVTEKIISSWYVNHPEFGMIFQEGKNISGVCIAIPLNKKGWSLLVQGKLKESEIGEEYLFNKGRDFELGIHIYHIEKLSNMKEFYVLALKALKEKVNALSAKNKKVAVIGFSGLCVSPSGIGLFEKKFSCEEKSYLCQEHILRNGKKLELFEPTSKKALELELKKGKVLVNRCKMLVSFPFEESIVWRYLA